MMQGGIKGNKRRVRTGAPHGGAAECLQWHVAGSGRSLGGTNLTCRILNVPPTTELEARRAGGDAPASPIQRTSSNVQEQCQTNPSLPALIPVRVITKDSRNRLARTEPLGELVRRHDVQ